MWSRTPFLLQHQTFSSLSLFQLVTGAAVALRYFLLSIYDWFICLSQTSSGKAANAKMTQTIVTQLLTTIIHLWSPNLQSPLYVKCFFRLPNCLLLKHQCFLSGFFFTAASRIHSAIRKYLHTCLLNSSPCLSAPTVCFRIHPRRRRFQLSRQTRVSRRVLVSR